MIIIKHRVNDVQDLKVLSSDFGAEIDLRSEDNELVLQHDPLKKGTSFRDWLKFYNHKTLIINQKEEGLEPMILELLKEKKVNNFFFLDQSIPFLVKHSKLLDQKSAARLSEYESIETFRLLLRHVKWAWLDCFSSISFKEKEIQFLKKNGIKLCLVSPELQGREPELEIEELLKGGNNPFGKKFEKLDAVCTKNIELWKSLIK